MVFFLATWLREALLRLGEGEGGAAAGEEGAARRGEWPSATRGDAAAAKGCGREVLAVLLAGA